MDRTTTDTITQERLWGLDRWLLPALGTRWQRAKAQVEAVSAVAEREMAG